MAINMVSINPDIVFIIKDNPKTKKLLESRKIECEEINLNKIQK